MTTHKYRITEDECPSCGATAKDRFDNKPAEPQGLGVCRHCGSEKCCMCDMGDDVECPSCLIDNDE